MAALACGREVDSTPPTGRSAEPQLTGAVAERAGNELLCAPSGNEPTAPASAARPKPRGKPPSTLAAAPARPGASRSLDLAIADAVAQDERASLDKAIASEVAQSERAQTLETTGATVPAPRRDDALAPARVVFRSRLPASYRLERVRVMVDGAMAYDASAAGDVDLSPGDHVAEVIADYRLDDPVFTYVQGYRVQLRSTEVVPASRAPTAFEVTAVPSGGVTTPEGQRAALTWRSSSVR
jgi:hypothetical protein